MDKHFIGIAVAALFLGALIGSMVGSMTVQKTWSYDAAQTQCAQFNPKSGHFEWLPPKLKIPSIK
jgi:hypothetical protein|tara:strand:- start:270 stop:464 length:195 start_codon:yes stop_codon:yes gene_type:complete